MFVFFSLIRINAQTIVANPQNSGVEGGEIQLLQSNATYNKIHLDNYAGNFRIFHSGVVRFNVAPDGNIGIGTTTPQAKLHITVNKDEISWPVIANNSRNNGTVSNYGVGVKLKHSNDNEHWKWGGIASIQETSWANASGLALYANETEYLRIRANGDVGIGTTTPDAKLAVNGNIHTKEIKVDLTNWPDYVFEDTYTLPTLQEVADHIATKGHLINIPSAAEVEENGIQLGEMNAKLLEKIEELTLYTIAQEKEIKELQKVKAKNSELEARLAKIEALLLERK